VTSDGLNHIGPLGTSDSESQIRLQVTGIYPDISDSVKLQWEIKPLGINFDTTGLEQSSNWVLADSTSGIELDELVSGLMPGTPHHWRARVVYRPGNPLGLDHSIWLSPTFNAWNETDFRTAGGVNPPEAIDDLMAHLLPGDTSSAGDILLTWSEPCVEAGLAYYVIHRSTAPSVAGDSLSVTTDTVFIDQNIVGDTLTNYYFLVFVVDQLGRKSDSSNQVGEFDLELTVPARGNRVVHPDASQ
jgi:hypothetical protein